MIPIANPIASKSVSEMILELTKIQSENKTIITGIKPCQKQILLSPKEFVMVFSATTSPMDLITHIPILCEENNVPYIFVENNSWINDFTCALLKITDQEIKYKKILEESKKIE